MAVVERKREKEGTALTGFKVQTSRFGICTAAPVPRQRLPRHRPRPARRRRLQQGAASNDGRWRASPATGGTTTNGSPASPASIPGRTLVVRYEDLVADPEPQYARIFGLLQPRLRRRGAPLLGVESRASTRHNMPRRSRLSPPVSPLGGQADLATVERAGVLERSGPAGVRRTVPETRASTWLQPVEARAPGRRRRHGARCRLNRPLRPADARRGHAAPHPGAGAVGRPRLSGRRLPRHRARRCRSCGRCSCGRRSTPPGTGC